MENINVSTSSLVTKNVENVYRFTKKQIHMFEDPSNKHLVVFHDKRNRLTWKTDWDGIRDFFTSNIFFSTRVSVA